MAITNWARNFEYGASSLHDAVSLDELPGWVKRQEKCKVLGTRHCFNDIADSKEVFLSLAGLNRIVALDPERLTVTVDAGIRYGELALFLHDHGFALHNLASLPHISVAGGVATATHGSGVGNGNLATAVIGMEFIPADGKLLHLTRDRSGDSFRGAVVHLGGIGVVTKLTLAIEPAYNMRQWVYQQLPMEALEQHFDAIMSAGYSVSLFTDWRNRQFSEVWIKEREGAGFRGGREFFGARAAQQDLHPISDLGAEHCTPQMGAIGPWHERLPHFRMGFTPSSGSELQSEYFVPREHSRAAILAVEGLREMISPHLLISEIRTIAADECWMSPCWRRDSTAIHFTWKPEWQAVRSLLPLIEQALEPFDARPHWGKLFTTPPKRLARSYQRMAEFRELLRSYDPAGKFRNAFLERNIFGS